MDAMKGQRKKESLQWLSTKRSSSCNRGGIGEAKRLLIY
ncbi:hypothetical protein RB5114 [Rhodopirellula baltica SH 1]|uniref:Uncharacterized protein n=1 Tax=Rhodopirellula baltica (strain DSM 10527 / NCIMB 13988 / SH1) TaxID=243090 RepID=Q7UGN3_RHOBA|nr:hypothetical protein RB5114 [Rhodopirellula baltica SH 1]